MNIINRKQIYTALLLLPYFFAVTGMLVLDSGDKKMIPLFLISIIVSILVFKKETILNNIQSPFVWLIGISCIYIVFSYYYHGASSRELRSLIATTLFLIFFPYKLLTKQLTRWIVLVGGLFVCLNSLYFNVYMDVARDAGYMNPIPYSTACALLAVISFSLLLESARKKEAIITLSAFLFYLPPIVLSETRGIWLAFSLSLVLLSIIKLKMTRPSNKSILLITAAVIAILFSGFMTFKDNISHRYEKTIYEIEKIKNNNYNTSIGLRLKMWSLAPDLFEKKPILGHGQEHREILKGKLKEKEISKRLFHFASSHYHNQYIDKMVKFGSIGLILLMSILIYPLITLRNLKPFEMYIVIGSTSLFFIAGLTDVPFNHAQTLTLYLLFLVPICSRIQRDSND
ncbi:O-antigen ligase family protein [Vibrio cyclitrophicus]|uniref:O-antigen ligase family protein n=1 Tax=Vibrio cyclitrophicus TaxID=47951 RepID=UPI000C841C89|nr:O-antigen ligase family protein [Vibrio cyclitrophicus]PMN20016.1 O-antigen ligase [Vibrio cyclitrophicus]